MTDDSLLRSIERDLKNEQYKRLWKKIQPWVLSGTVFVVLSVSGSVAYVQYQTSLREGWGEKLHQAIVDINEKSWQQAQVPVQDLVRARCDRIPQSRPIPKCRPLRQRRQH